VPEPDASFESSRAAMVARQLRDRGIRDERVLAAMATVPREAFLPVGQRDVAYIDAALPIGDDQTISQPYMVALMTELLDVGPGDRVLDVGTGSGYQAAVLAEMGCAVVSVERLDDLAVDAHERLRALGYEDRVEIHVADGTLGYPPRAPYRGIVVGAAAPTVPAPLREQLDADGGRLVVPVGPRHTQELTVVTRQGEQWAERAAGGCIFVPLIGAEGFAGR
jgi:protein-L-isoaspartate(D-aspartate) O-methyltransferase